jgi:cell division transport system permease protein
MRAWLWHHRDAFGRTITRLARTPVGTLISIGVIGIALALPLGLYVGLVNLHGLTRSLAADPELSVFLALDAGPAEVKRIEARIRNHPSVRGSRFVPR